MIISILPPLPTIRDFVEKIMLSVPHEQNDDTPSLHLIQLNGRMWLENIKAYVECLDINTCIRYECEDCRLEILSSEVLLVKVDLTKYNMSVIVNGDEDMVEDYVVFTNVSSLEVDFDDDDQLSQEDPIDVSINFKASGKLTFPKE